MDGLAIAGALAIFIGLVIWATNTHLRGNATSLNDDAYFRYIEGF